MHRLPPLSRDSRRFALPLADRSAAILGDVLLSDAPMSDAPSEQAPRLAAALYADPTFLLWGICAGSRNGLVAECVEDVADWLVSRLLDFLDWPSGDDTRGPARDDPLAGRLGPLVARSLAVAELAAALAEAGGAEAIPQATLGGLTAAAEEMLLAAEPEAGGELAGLLPEWLAEGWAVSADITQAQAILDGEALLPEGLAFDLDACRDRAEQGRRRWQAADRRAEWLPCLAARGRRLRALELRFRETVEAEKLEAMAEFAAGAGHEINNPLTVISGRAQLFLRDELDPEKRRALALISAQAMRVYEMISDLMLYARPPQPEPQSIDAVVLLDQVVGEMVPEAERQEITLRRAGGDEPVSLEADPTQLTVALKAMCRNAIEAIGREGTIELLAESRGGDVLLHVSDDGPGIPPDERRHIFDPYYSARQAGRGLGMGLSKAWRIVTNHGGRIDVESEPGEGATFTIVLPQSVIRP